MTLPKGRSILYAEWRSCERFGILPAGVKRRFEDNDWWTQLHLIAYDQIRSVED